MKLLLLSLLIAIFTLSSVFADAEYCEYEGLKLKVDESAPHPSKCQIIHCQKGGDVSALTCGEFKPQPGCSKSKIDNSKRYPDCCPVQVCP